MRPGEMDKAKYASTDIEKQSAFARGMLYMVDAMMEDQWLEQASGFIKAIEGSESFDKYIARTSAGFIPYHAAFSSMKKFEREGRPQLSQDSIYSSVSNMVEDQVRGNMPNFGMEPHFVRVKRNWDGSVHMPEQTQFAAGASPWGPTKLEGDSLTKLLFENGVFPTEPSSIMTIGPKSFSLLQLDESGRLYDSYLQEVGKGRREVLQRAMDEGKIDLARDKAGEGPNSGVARVLNTTMSLGKQLGFKNWLEGLSDVIEDNPEIANALNERFDTDVKAMIEEAMYDPENAELEGPAAYQPTRSPLEFPIPEMK